jgi:hypothetical protein
MKIGITGQNCKRVERENNNKKKEIIINNNKVSKP